MQISNNEKAEKRKHRTLRKSTKRFMAAFCVLFTVVSAVFIASGTRNSAMQGTNNKVLLKVNTAEAADKYKAELDKNDIPYEEISSNTLVATYKTQKQADKFVTEIKADAKNSQAADSDDENQQPSDVVMADSDILFELADDKTSNAGNFTTPTDDDSLQAVLKNREGKKVVAIIDSGVNTGADYQKNFTDSPDKDTVGHGTRMASIIRDGNEDKVSIISLKAIGDNGRGHLADVYKAVQFAMENHVDIISMSISAKDNPDNMGAFKTLVQSAVAQGIKVVASAGNNGADAKDYVPANIPGVITVGAVDENHTVRDFSNNGEDVGYYAIADSTSEAAAHAVQQIIEKDGLANSDVIRNDEVADNKGNSNTSDKFEYSSPDLTDEQKRQEEDEAYRKAHWREQYEERNAGKNISGDINGEFTLTGWDDGDYYDQENTDLGMNGGWVFFCKRETDDTDMWDPEGGVYHDADEWHHYGAYFSADPDKHGLYLDSIVIDEKNWLTANQKFNVYYWNGSGWSTKEYIGDQNNWSQCQYRNNDPYDSDRNGPYGVRNTCTPSDGNRVFIPWGWTIGIQFSGTIKRDDWGSNGVACFTRSGLSGSNRAYGDHRAMSTKKYNFKAPTPQYTVTYNANGGSGSMASQTVTYGDSFMTRQNTFTRTGYTFNGWTADVGGNWGLDATGVYENGRSWTWTYTQNVTLSASWKPNTYTLHYNENGGVLHDNAAKDGNKNTVTYDSADYWSGSSATRDHYTFDGFWTASSGGTQVFGADGNAVNGTGYWKNNVWCWAGDNGTIIELYAHWIPVSYPVDVNMILEHNNGTEQAAYSGVNDKDHNNVIALFDASASGSAENDVHDYYESLPYDSTITISNIRPQAGYYYKNSSGKWVPYGKSDGGQSYKLDENLKPYWDGSQWTIPLHMRPARQTVIYDLNEVATLAREGLSAHNGFERPTGAPAQQTIEYGTPTNLNSANTVWPGHTLRGWSTNANAATPEYTPGEANAIVDKLKTDGRITFYAVWDVSKTTLTVDQAEGTWTGTTPRTAQWGTSFDLGEPTPPNWTSTVHFDKNFEGDEAAEHYQLNGQQDVVLRYIFNKWVLQNGAKGFIETNGTHNVYYYQSTSDTVTAKYYFQTTILPKPSRTGYTFLGWYRESGCLRKAGNNGDAYRSANDVRSETLYARWRKDVYTYKDTLEEYDRDDRDSTTGVFIRKVNGYSVPITTKGFTIALYKQGESTPVLRFKTGEGVYNSHNQLVNSTADTDGWYKVPDSISLPDGTYIAKEEDSLPGWTRDDDKTYTISRANKRTQIQMKDERFNIPNNPPVKKDDYGRQLSDVEFKLYDNTAKHDYGTVKFIKVEDDASHAHLDFESKFYQSLTATHSYTLTETKVPGGGRGFDAASYTFTVPKSGQLDPITITDPAVILGSLQVRKVNHDNQPLAGAKFQLMMKDADGNLIPCMRNKANKQWTTETDANTAEPMIVTTGTNGIATFSGLPVEANFTGSEPESCKSYYLKEIEAPAGYNKIDKVMEIRLSSDPTKQSVQQYTVKDGTITLTLDAGGNGIATYASAGSVMLAMALIVLMIRKSRKSAVKQN